MAKIESLEQLESLYPDPQGRAVIKVIDSLDPHCRKFISLSPFVVIGTTGAHTADVSPKGGEPGFVKPHDDRTLLIPDWHGNNRLDSYRNLFESPQVGLIFLIPGVRETLRVNGTAEIRDDTDLRASFEMRGKLPRTVMLVQVVEAFLHCAKAIMRSRLWEPDARIDRTSLPTIGEMIADQTASDRPVETDAEMVARYTKQLY